MQEQVTHIVHDRTNDHQRTIGYRIQDNANNSLKVICAETRCHPNDNFNRRVARGHVNCRLDSYQKGARSPNLRVFEADISMRTPTTASEYRELEQTLLLLSDYRLPRPAALQE